MDDEQFADFVDELRLHAMQGDEGAEDGPLQIDFSAFTALVGERQGAKEMEMRSVWPLFDSDGDGALSYAEVGKAMNQCGIPINEETLKTMLSEADRDGDGLITFEEFCESNSSALWKKAVTMLSIKKKFVAKMLSIADQVDKFKEAVEDAEEDVDEEDAEEVDVGKLRLQLMRRYALREHPLVRGAILEMYNVMDGLRRKPADMVHKELFLTYFLKIAKVVLKEEFDPKEHLEWAEEEWGRMLQRYATVNGGAESDVIDFDVFYESMFELIDIEVSGKGDQYITPEAYAKFIGSPYDRSGLFDEVFAEQVSPGRKLKKKGKAVSSYDNLRRVFRWKETDNNFTGIDQWESVDRQAAAALVEGLQLDHSATNFKSMKRTSSLRRQDVLLASDPRAEAGKTFRALDTSGDGLLSLSEITCALSDFGLSEEEIDRMIMKLDTNLDGVVDEAEFVAGYKHWTTVVSAHCGAKKWK